MLEKEQDLRATVVDLLEDEYLTNCGKEPIELYNEEED